jgi:hypothetical protein
MWEGFLQQENRRNNNIKIREARSEYDKWKLFTGTAYKQNEAVMYELNWAKLETNYEIRGGQREILLNYRQQRSAVICQ